MISRRKFLKYTGATAFVSFAAAKLAALKSEGLWYLPLVLGSSDMPVPTPTPVPPDPTNKRIRLAFNLHANFGFGLTDVEVPRILDYFQALGFTHYLYFLQPPYESVFSKSTGSWVYNNGNYTTEKIAERFQVMKAMVESRGMQLVPGIISISHCESYIVLDNEISEFMDKKSLVDWLCHNYGITYCGDSPCPNHIAFVGDYYSTNRVPNEGMDQFCLEYLRIIRSNWPSTSGPEYIHIGHDELGFMWACGIKAQKSAGMLPTKSQLVAAEINERLRMIHQEISPSTQVMIYGDSFLPADYGETYEMVGDLKTGIGGVLQTLRDEYQIADELIVLPWIYSYPDGYYDDGRQLSFSKVRQIAYLNRLGIRYIPCTGEDGAPDERFTQPKIDKIQQTTFEWVRASQMFPKYLIGFAHLGWNSNGCDPVGVCHDYNACLLAYLAWQYEERSLMKARRNSYGPRIFFGVDYALSSRERKWVEGVHYSRPPSRVNLLALAGQ